MVLKPNMIVSGIGCSEQTGVEEVADRTVEVLKTTVPDDVPGCAFLSGGQSNENATAHLNMMNSKHIQMGSGIFVALSTRQECTSRHIIRDSSFQNFNRTVRHFFHPSLFAASNPGNNHIWF
jgi:fructose-bisphosphate aldolase class 1